MVQFTLCQSNEDWSRYTAFYLAHRQQVIPNYQVKHVLLDVIHCIKHGRAALLTAEGGRAIGIGGFVLGLERQRFEHKEIAVLNNCCFVASHRGNRTFIRGLQVLAEQIADMQPDVSEVRIPAMAANAYTNGLYQKFAELLETTDSEYGPVHTYTTTFEHYKSFCNRFR